MDDPARAGTGIPAILQYRPGMDPQRAAGILSRVYFFMTQGSWPLQEAYDVFYTANRLYWSEGSGFVDAAVGTLGAACELLRGNFLPYDYDGRRLNDLAAAWAKVGLRCTNSTNCNFKCTTLKLASYQMEKLNAEKNPFDAWLIENVEAMEAEAIAKSGSFSQQAKQLAQAQLAKTPLKRGQGFATQLDGLKTYFRDLGLVQRGNVTVDSLGSVHSRFRQTYRGLRVLATDLVFQKFIAGRYNFLDDDNKTRIVVSRPEVKVNGLFIGGLSPNGFPDPASLDEQSLKTQALDLMRSGGRDLVGNSTGWAFVRTGMEFVVRVEESDKERPVRLCVECDFFGHGPAKAQPRRPYLLAEVRPDGSLRLLQAYDALSTRRTKARVFGAGGNVKTGRREVVLEVERDEAGLCHFQSDLVRTVRLSGQGASTDSLALPCDQIPRQPPINGAFGPASDAHYFSHHVMQFYLARYRSNPFGGRLRVEVEGAAEDNAHWDGEELVLYNGAEFLHPTVNPGIIGHEIGHGLTEAGSNLAYAEQSGGVNEAFSDALAKVAEHLLLGRDPKDFSIGKDTAKGRPLRFMDHPPKETKEALEDGRSIGHVRDFKEGMDVHFSSGIFNKAFARMASSPSFSLLEALDCFVVANKYYWGRTSTFNQAAAATLRAACDLQAGRYMCEIDHTGLVVEEAVAAFSSVGIECFKDDPFGRDCLFTCSGAPETQRDPKAAGVAKIQSFAAGFAEGGP